MGSSQSKALIKTAGTSLLDFQSVGSVRVKGKTAVASQGGVRVVSGDGCTPPVPVKAVWGFFGWEPTPNESWLPVELAEGAPGWILLLPFKARKHTMIAFI